MACWYLTKEEIYYIVYGVIEVLLSLGISIGWPKIGQLWYCGAQYNCGCTWSFDGGVTRCNIKEYLPAPGSDTPAPSDPTPNPNYGKPFCPWCNAKSKVAAFLVNPDCLTIIMFLTYLAVACYQWRKYIKLIIKELKFSCNKNKETSEIDMDEITTNNNNNGVDDYHPHLNMPDLMKEEADKGKYYTKLICKGFWSRVMVPFYTFFIWDTIMGFIFWRASDYPHWFGIDR